MAAPSETVYKYEILPGEAYFRLLKLYPGKINDALQCELHVHKLGLFEEASTVPRFQALSYVWGPQPPSQDIRCNGKILRITKSLDRELRRVRSQRSEIFVWADALCINQSDLRERKQQVALMRRIFSRAKVVTVCLNLDETISTEHQGFLAKFLRKPNSPMFSHPKSVLDISRCAERGPAIVDVAVPPQLPSIFAAFFDNPWFNRIWVIQEVAESQRCRVLVGDQVIPWKCVVRLARRLFRSATYGSPVLQFMRTNGVCNVLFMNNHLAFSQTDPIPALLQSARDFEASDPRDKVYAMLHTPIRRRRIYTRFPCLSPQNYVKLAAQLLSLTCLLSATLERTPRELSFWQMLFSWGCTAYFFRFFHLVKAVARDFYQRFIDFLLRLQKVLLRGYQLTDTVGRALSLTADYSLTTQTLYKTVAARVIERSGSLDILCYVCHGSDIDTTSSFPSWVPRWDQPTRGAGILVAQSPFQYRASANMTHTWKKSNQQGDHLTVEGVRLSTVSSVSNIVDGVQDSQLGPTSLKHCGRSPATRFSSTHLAPGGRRFSMSNGIHGFGPWAMKEGDIVCVLFGGSFPYILRGTDTDNMYRLVGACFAYGMMNGAAIEQWQQGQLALERFTLC
jgi:hypothetical protein